MRSRIAGLVLGYAADQLLADPERWHPVAGFGSLATRVERYVYAADRVRGTAHVALLVGSVIGLGSGVERVSRRRPWAQTVVTATATWMVLGGRSLVREGQAIERQLGRDDLSAARAQLLHLVGRDTRRLTGQEIARACVESVAENTSDAVVAPLVWGAAFGVPGLVGYRAVNTLDAMIGHRNARYHEFGWAAARLDDALNWVPARLAAAATLGVGLATHGPEAVRRGCRAIVRDAARHPSPNAGVVEAAFAGVLGVTLGGTNSYAGTEQNRGRLGTGPGPTARDVRRAYVLSERVGWWCLVALTVTGHRRRPAVA